MSILKKHGIVYDSDQEFDVATGKLTLEQINLIYRHMPVDLSYVDENDIVKFYTDTEHRVFLRSKNVIGRDVMNCHPKASAHIVREIIDKFRSGEENYVEFWINKPGLFIYITYTAVRDSKGNFRGILEMMQDCTHIRSLEGSRTLLTWQDEENNAANDDKNVDEVKNSGDSEVEHSKVSAEDADSKVEIDVENINPETRLKDLLAAYPDLKSVLPTINEKFKMLNTPLARIMIPKANVATMAERTEMDIDDLISKLKEAIKGM